MLNHELSLRGCKELKTCSQNLVLNKSSDLLKSDQFNKFQKQAKDIKDLKQQWSSKMEQMEKEGMILKEAASLTEEKKKLEDLEFLKAQTPPGPFTSAENVDSYMEEDRDEKEKNERLYKEVRYAKLSCSNMKRSSTVFRLKKNYKNLESVDYAHNLKAYFGCVTSIKQITLADFGYILTGLNAASVPGINTETDNEVADSVQPQPGEHIAGVWADEKDPTGQTLTWHIGVVESVSNDGAMVSYLIQSNNKSKANWMFPETSSTFYTPKDQIIMASLKVEYTCVTIIRCRIANSIIKELDCKFEEYMKQLNN